MKTTNLVITPVKYMHHTEWLAFRQPVNHVRTFIDSIHNGNEITYESLTHTFKTNEWYEFVFPCIGSSEMSTVMGLNPYQSIIELFYLKVGIKEQMDFDNSAMFWGRELEEQIAQKWQYWDKDADSMIQNYKTEKMLRRCRKLNAYIQNMRSEWIFVSVDRIINQLKNGKETKTEGILECKCISGYTADQWEHGFPPGYVIQQQTQLGTIELTYGEIGLLKDGRHMEVYPFDYNESIYSTVVRKSKLFFDSIKKSLEHFFLAQYAEDLQTKLDHLAEIDRLAPEPDGSIAYENYLKENKTDKGIEKRGGDEEFGLAVDYLKYKSTIEDWEVKQRECSNKLKTFMGEGGSFIDFGERGYVSWRADVKGTRRFMVKIKTQQRVSVT
jgi:putative phage-type endonuclease